MNAAADAATSRGPWASAAPPERLPLASQAEARAQQREPEQQAVAQLEERPARQQLGSRASAQQRPYLPQGLSPQELLQPEPLQLQSA